MDKRNRTASWVAIGLAVPFFTLMLWGSQREKAETERAMRAADQAVVHDAQFEAWINPGYGMIVENQSGFGFEDVEMRVAVGEGEPDGVHAFGEFEPGRKWVRLDTLRDGLEDRGFTAAEVSLYFRHGTASETRTIPVKVSNGAHWLDTKIATDLNR